MRCLDTLPLYLVATPATGPLSANRQAVERLMSLRLTSVIPRQFPKLLYRIDHLNLVNGEIQAKKFDRRQ